MENLKIKVDSDKESKEIQELFFKLGADWKYRNIGKKYHHDDKIGFLYCDGESITTGEKDYGLDYFKNRSPHHKEITIQQLRDMVVLKRNSAEDANYTCDREKKYYVTSNDVYMYIHQGVWSLCENFPLEKAIEHWKLKPIQKEKTMKEWIYKDGSGKYVLTTDPEVANLASDAVEVPCGAEILCWFEGDKDSFFYKSNDHIFKDGEWSYVGHGWKFKDLISGNAGKLLWQREKPQEKCADKLPMEEALEFAEELRNMGESGWSKEKHSHYKKDVSHLNVIDPYRIADLYDLHPCAEHIMKKSLCAGGRGHKDLLRDIQDIIDTAERWKEMIEEDNREV